MDTQQNIRIIFNEKSDEVLSGIMKKYQLEEPLDKMSQNILAGKLNNIVILNRLTKSFARGELNEKSLSDSLQKEIGATTQIASEISKEIVNNLVPTLQKISEEEIEKQNKENVPAEQPKTTVDQTLMPKIKAPIEVEKIMEEINAKQSTQEEKIITPVEKEIEKPMPTKTRKAVMPKKEIPVVKKSSKPDPYKEAIE